MAVAKKKKEVFTTGDGRKINLKRIDPVFLQAVISSVRMPDKPTYEAKVGTAGRVEVHPMDEESAKQTEGGEELWKAYNEELTSQSSKQTERSLRALFLDGTVEPDGEFIDQEWQRKMRIIDMDLPVDTDELWVMYLMMTLQADDIVRISTAIMRLTGVDEELIQQAEDSFRDSVQDES